MSNMISYLESSSAPRPLFNCANCEVLYHSSEEQRQHMRSDWHVYNLKRRIATLAPISAAIFADEIVAQSMSEGLAAPDEHRCGICQKTYQSPKQLRGHLRSQRHMLEVSKQEDSLDSASAQNCDQAVNNPDDDLEVSEPDSQLEFNSTSCLFCIEDSDSTDENMLHMAQKHGLFVPNQEYLIDLESLLSYLFFLVSEFHECLHCGAVKGSVEGVQHHMTSKGHCTINLDESSRLSEFYEMPEDMNIRKPSTEDEKELRLGSKIVGHRSESRTYKQRFVGRTTMLEDSILSTTLTEAISDATTTPASTSIALQLRNTDSQSLVGISDAQIRTLQSVERKVNNMQARIRVKYERKLERHANYQKHFRPDVPGRPNGVS